MASTRQLNALNDPPANTCGPDKNQRKTSKLLSMPSDLIRYCIFSKLDNNTLANFSKGSSDTLKLAQPVLKQRTLKKLFEHIRDGDIARVKNMLSVSPHLALTEWKAECTEEKVYPNKPGQLISVQGKTAYEFALGEEDTEIAALLRDCIVKVSDERIANALFHKQYPDGWEIDEEKRSAPIFTQLDVLTLAIRNAQRGDITSSDLHRNRLAVREGSAVARALLQFQTLLDATLTEIVITGRHFNPHLLLGAFKIYDDHYQDYFGNNWDDPRALLFWQRVIGYIQRFMPANYVQAFCSGIFMEIRKLQNGTSLSRSFTLETDHFTGEEWTFIYPDFYPLTNSRIGVDYAIYQGNGVAGAIFPSLMLPHRDYFNQKTVNLQSLLNTRANEVESLESNQFLNS